MRSSSTAELTLADLCEPLFQHMCRLSRAARKSAESGAGSVAIGSDPDEVRSGIKQQFQEMQERASREGILDQFDRVRLPLVFFCDYFIQNSQLPFAHEWRAMAEVDEDPPHMAWYQEFFSMLEETLEEKSDAADERLVIYYTILGLGFKGYFEDNPKMLQDKMRDIAKRIRNRIEPETSSDICEQAYKYTDKRELSLPAAKTLTPIALALVGLIGTLFFLNLYLFHSAAGDIQKATQAVVDANKNVDAVAQK
jgi:hypothetical protein